MKNKNKISRDALGILIKKSREEHALSISELVDAINFSKVNNKKIEDWEKGKDFPNLDEIYKLADIFKINPNEMLEIKNKILKENVKPVNEAARRVTDKALGAVKPSFKVLIVFIEILIAIILAVVYKWIHISYENSDAPIVTEVEQTLDYYRMDLEAKKEQNTKK